MNFETYTESTRAFIADVAFELGTPSDTARAFRVTRAVFVALRERLTVEESFDLLSQLPFMLKAVYIDGWKPSRQKAKAGRHLSDFLAEVRQADMQSMARDFGNDHSAQESIQAVFRVLKRKVSGGEVDHITGGFPKELKNVWINA